MAFQVREQEYDLYMRADSNTRGHHQWFYFKVLNHEQVGRYRFNIVNFTKNASLYHQGMRINVHSSDKEGWSKGGENIVYKLSKISQPKVVPGQGYVFSSAKRYFQLSFDYDFTRPGDTVSFAYSVPFTFSRLQHDLATLQQEHLAAFPKRSKQYLSQSVLCKSLSGLDVPLLTITSRVHHKHAELLDPRDFS
jgi:hypothetical protein